MKSKFALFTTALQDKANKLEGPLDEVAIVDTIKQLGYNNFEVEGIRARVGDKLSLTDSPLSVRMFWTTVKQGLDRYVAKSMKI